MSVGPTTGCTWHQEEMTNWSWCGRELRMYSHKPEKNTIDIYTFLTVNQTTTIWKQNTLGKLFFPFLCRLIGPSTVFGSSNKLANVEQWRCVTILRNHTGGKMPTKILYVTETMISLKFFVVSRCDGCVMVTP